MLHAALASPPRPAPGLPLKSDEVILAEARAAAGASGTDGASNGAPPERGAQRLVFQHLTVQACRNDCLYLEGQACLRLIVALREAGWQGGDADRLLRLAVGLQLSPDFSCTHAIRSFLETGARADFPGTRPGWSCAQQAAAMGILGVGIDFWMKAGLNPVQETPEGDSLLHLLLDPASARVMVPFGSGTWPAVLAVAERWDSSDWGRFDGDGTLSQRLRESWNTLVDGCPGSAPEWDARAVLERAQAEREARWLENLPEAGEAISGRF